MEPEMRKAWTTAGLKMGIGLFVVAGLLGIRIVTVVPDHASWLASRNGKAANSFERFDRNQGAAVKVASDAETGPQADSNGSAGPSAPPVLRDGDRLVSCQLPRGAQFMTADDCAMRGGASTLFRSQR